MYKILLFDDRPQVRISLEEKFMSAGMIVYSCRNVYEAKDKWNLYHSELNAIVIDMMMPSLGLDRKLRPQTKGGLLTGWVWLWSELNPNNETMHPAKDKCIVVYSAYLKDFEAYIAGNHPSEEEKIFAKDVKRIEKGTSENEDEVLDYLQQDYNKRMHLKGIKVE